MIAFLDQLFVIQTQNSSYVMKINETGELMQMYYGKKLLAPCELDEPVTSAVFSDHIRLYKYTPEYPVRVRGFYDEPCLTARMPDGVKDLQFVYESHSIEGDTLRIVLKDVYYKVRVRLQYKVFESMDLIDKSAEIENYGESEIVLTDFKTGAIYFPHSQKYVMMHQWGFWSNEYRKELTLLAHGKTVLETRRGICSGPQHVPFFAVGEESVSETAGEVRYGFLHYNGNFKIVAEQNSGNVLCVTAGINDYDTEITLKEGARFALPVITTGYSGAGFEKMSLSLYDYQFDYCLPRTRIGRTMPMIYNSWYPFEFDVDEEKCIALLDKVKEMGAELFVIDDGWFNGRTTERTSLGDWTVDLNRFPSGIRAVSDAAHAKGLLFGLWMEPEMVNPDASLYEEHPEWVLRYPTRETVAFRWQYVLDLSRQDVMEFVWQTADRLVRENNLDYLKWDMNRYIAEVNVERKDFYVQVAANVREVWRRLNEKYPDLLLECCAHGGARTDYSMLEYCDRINRSDNSDPVDVLRLHEGFTTYILPRLAGGAGNVPLEFHPMNNRVSPLEYRAHLGMTGSMSVGMNLLTIEPSVFEELKGYVREFKCMRKSLHNSYVYRLRSAFEGNLAVWEYLERSGESAHVFLFGQGLTRRDRLPRLKLRGLQAEAKYEVDGKTYLGDTLMNYGLEIVPFGDYYSKIIKIRRV